MTPQELREQYLQQPVSADGIPTVTVRAGFDWTFWLLMGAGAWIAYEFIMRDFNRPGLRHRT